MPDQPNQCFDPEFVRRQLVARFNMNERDNWGRETPKSDEMDPSGDYYGVAIHHYGNGAGGALDIEAKHMGEKNWPDVGYHFMIAMNGDYYEGRHLQYKGSHVLLRNTGVIGIQMMGDFHHQFWDFDDDFTASHKRYILELVKELQCWFTLTTLGGHSEWVPNHTACPGNAINPWMATLRRQTGLAAP